MKSIHFPPPAADEAIRGLLANRKTATRRVVKSKNHSGTLEMICGMPHEKITKKPPFTWAYVPCVPPYLPGDILYVRETWTTLLGSYLYRANQKPGMKNPGKWYPSIHMPREAARIFLRVTDVRVERLQEITNRGIENEGITRRDRPGGCSCKWKTENCMQEPCANRDAYDDWCWKLPFIEAWDSTIKAADRAICGWDANPWVWVTEFERISKEEAENHGN